MAAECGLWTVLSSDQYFFIGSRQMKIALCSRLAVQPSKSCRRGPGGHQNLGAVGPATSPVIA